MIDQSLLTFPVLHETSHEAIVIKPAGMASELTSDPKGVSLISQMRRACPPPMQPKLPHRLDRVTRGVLLVALTAEAIAFHGEQIRSGRWEKFYLARVRAAGNGNGTELLGHHKAYLKRVGQRSQVVRAGGKPSFLEVLAMYPAPGRPDEAHLLIKLLTGRFHQVRVMLANLGVPLVDDFVYGNAETHRGRDREEFYLEHVLLKYDECATEARTFAYLRQDPDREAIAPGLRNAIEALID